MTAAGPPVLFLDVDGVIATFVDPANDYSDPRVNWTRNEQARVRYNPAVTGWIHELASLAEVRWLTAWEKKAAAVLAPALGLPAFDVVRFKDHRHADLDWKHSAVLAQLEDEPGRPVVWADDEPEYRDAYDHLVPFAKKAGTPLFIVRPAASDGITEAHMIRIRTFLAAARQSRHHDGDPAGGSGDQAS